jgi:hypothetical protein
MVTAHILLALVSIVTTTYGWIRPSRACLFISSTLIVMVGITGILLILTNNASLARVCITGLIYTVISVGVVRQSAIKLSRAALV